LLPNPANSHSAAPSQGAFDRARVVCSRHRPLLPAAVPGNAGAQDEVHTVHSGGLPGRISNGYAASAAAALGATELIRAAAGLSGTACWGRGLQLLLRSCVALHLHRIAAGPSAAPQGCYKERYPQLNGNIYRQWRAQRNEGATTYNFTLLLNCSRGSLKGAGRAFCCL
jgi:hypothetical protein